MSWFTILFLQPLFNLLIGLNNILPGHEIGWAIVALTILVKLVLYPFSVTQIKQQRAMQELQPKIDEIRERLKGDQEAQGRELMALYSREKVNPAASCLPLLIQLPIFIGLYQALSRGLNAGGFDLLYSFISRPASVDVLFLGILDLTKPNAVLAIGSALVQYWQSRQIMTNTPGALKTPPKEAMGTAGAKDESMTAIMNKQMLYLMPAMTALIGFSLPAGLTLYWFVMSLLSVLQQWYIMKRMPPKMTAVVSAHDAGKSPEPPSLPTARS